MSTKTKTRPLNIDFIGSMVFWLFQIGNIIEGFGYFIPQIYLPCEPLGILNDRRVLLTGS
jgi:hypothetical protein